MTTMRVAIVALTMFAGLAMGALGPVAADASDGRRVGSSSPSVFPQPRDPWRSWGVHTHLPKHVGPPRHDHGWHQAPEPQRVWIPGHWVWDGAGWVWWAGHWGVR